MPAFGSRGVSQPLRPLLEHGLGFYRLSLPNRHAVVSLATEGGWVGLSPDHPDEFVERPHARAGLHPPRRPAGILTVDEGLDPGVAVAASPSTPRALGGRTRTPSQLALFGK